MEKLLKMLVMAEFILVLAVIALTLIDGKKTNAAAFVVKENPGIEDIRFKITTRAVCEEKPEHIFCHDELLIKCNDAEYLLNNNSPDSIECNNIKINLSDIKSNGKNQFRKEWVDHRNQ